MTDEMVTQPRLAAADALEPPMSEIGQHIQTAIEKDLDIDKLKQLFEMKRVEEDRVSMRAYLKAKAQFQKECPKIPHDKRAKTPGANWSYASLGLICDTISPFLGKRGLSFRWTGEGERMRCVLTHDEGHSESASFTLSIEGQKGGLANMTQQQRQGSADTYAKGRTLCAVCGIGTSEEDTGGVGADAGAKDDKSIGQEAHEKIAKQIQLDWLHARHELHKKPKDQKQRAFAAWFLEHTDATTFTPVSDRWTSEQLVQCRAQLDKEKETADYAKTHTRNTKEKPMDEIADEATTLVQITDLSVTVITQLKARLAGLKADTHAGYESVKVGIAEVTKWRTGVEAARKKLVAPYIAAQKHINLTAYSARDQFLEIETPLRVEKARVDDEAERRRKEKVEAERLAIESKERAEREAREQEQNAQREIESKQREAEAAKLIDQHKALAEERTKLQDERREQQKVLDQQRRDIANEQFAMNKQKLAIEEEARKQREAKEADELAAREKEEREKEAELEKVRLAEEKIEAERLAEERKPDRKKLEEIVERLGTEFELPEMTTDWGHKMCYFAGCVIIDAANQIRDEISFAGPPDDQSSPSDM